MLPHPTLDVISHSAASTRRIGRALGHLLRGGDVVLLSGDLGAGKTTLAQGIATGLAIASAVTSPTFALVNEYAGQDADGTPVLVAHIDLYRLTGEVASLGLDDYFGQADVVSIVEWPQVAPRSLPESALIVAFTALSASKRRLTFRGIGMDSIRYTEAIALLRQELYGAAAR